jgi:type I restriction enzyme S subunit
MAGEWPKVTIESLLESGAITGHKDGNHGSDYPRVEEFGTSGVPFLTAKSLSEGRLDVDGAPRLADDKADRLHFGFLKPGDVLLSHNATIGRVGIVPDFTGRLLIGTSLTYFRLDNSRIFPRYLAAYFSGADFQNQLAAVMSHTTRNQIPITAQRQLQIVLPPLAQQKAIAAVLGVLDDKIELNRRMNATLEAMARALFQSWFVDFDPVRAKLDGRKPDGLDKATAALFSAAFQDSPLGPIPQGWKVRSLDETANYLNGLALQNYPPGDGSTLSVIKIAQLRKGDTDGADRCSADLPPEYIIHDGDVLFSWSGSLEVELWCGGSGALNQHLFKVTSAEFPKWFCYLWTLHHLDEFRLIAAGKATTMGHIQRGHLTAAKVIVPPRPLLDVMTSVASPLIEQIVGNRIQSRTLASLRDTLLPKLLSGEIEIFTDSRHAGVSG